MIWELHLYSSIISLLSLSLSAYLPIHLSAFIWPIHTFTLWTLTFSCLLDRPSKCWRSCNIRFKPVPRLASFSFAQSLFLFCGLPYFPFIPYIKLVTRSRHFYLLRTSVSTSSFLIPRAAPWHQPPLTLPTSQCLRSFCLWLQRHVSHCHLHLVTVFAQKPSMACNSRHIKSKQLYLLVMIALLSGYAFFHCTCLLTVPPKHWVPFSVIAPVRQHV